MRAANFRVWMEDNVWADGDRLCACEAGVLSDEACMVGEEGGVFGEDGGALVHRGGAA